MSEGTIRRLGKQVGLPADGFWKARNSFSNRVDFVEQLELGALRKAARFQNAAADRAAAG